MSRLRGPGPRAELEAGPWSRAERVGLALFALAVLASLAWFVHPWYEANSDSAMYIATARSLVDGDGYTMLGMPFRVRPPGFSLLLAPVLALAGTDFAALNSLVAAFGAALAILLLVFLRARIGYLLALLVAASVWLNPGFQRMCNQVLSDVPGAALWLGCLLLERWAARLPSARREVLLGAAIGLASYVRSSSILLVPAIVLSRLIARWLDRGAPDDPAEKRLSWPRFAGLRLGIVAAVAFAVVVPWTARNAITAPPGAADQTKLYDYWTATWHRDLGDPTSPRKGVHAMLEPVPVRMQQMAAVLGSRLQGRSPGAEVPIGKPPPLYPLTALLLIVCLLIVGVRRRAPADLFCIGNLVLISVYFGFAPRLLLPVYVLALPAVVEVARDLLRLVLEPRIATGIAAAGLALLMAGDLEPRRGWVALQTHHLAFVERAAAVDAMIAPDARVASRLGYNWSVYLERPVYSLHHTLQRAGRVDAVEQVIDKYGIDTVVLSPTDVNESQLVPYFRTRYGRGTRAADVIVWRVRTPAGSGGPQDD